MISKLLQQNGRTWEKSCKTLAFWLRKVSQTEALTTACNGGWWIGPVTERAWWWENWEVSSKVCSLLDSASMNSTLPAFILNFGKCVRYMGTLYNLSSISISLDFFKIQIKKQKNKKIWLSCFSEKLSRPGQCMHSWAASLIHDTWTTAPTCRDGRLVSVNWFLKDHSLILPGHSTWESADWIGGSAQRRSCHQWPWLMSERPPGAATPRCYRSQCPLSLSPLAFRGSATCLATHSVSHASSSDSAQVTILTNRM